MDLFADLHEKGNHITWLIGVRDSNNYDIRPTDCTFSGFSVTNNGLIMSVAHGFHKMDLEKVIINGRRLDMNVYKRLKVKCIHIPWDVVILEAEDLEDDDFGEFVTDGTLYGGQPLLICGNPGGYIGLDFVGTVSVPCVEDVTLPTGDEKCGLFDSDVWKTAEPRYRMFGDMWNKRTCCRNESGDENFYKNCDPRVPYILCHGFNTEAGLSGSPALNSDGKIVGMLTGTVAGYGILIHVTILRHFLYVLVLDNTLHPLQKNSAEKNLSKKQLAKKRFKAFFQDMEDN